MTTFPAFGIYVVALLILAVAFVLLHKSRRNLNEALCLLGQAQRLNDASEFNSYEREILAIANRLAAHSQVARAPFGGVQFLSIDVPSMLALGVAVGNYNRLVDDAVRERIGAGRR